MLLFVAWRNLWRNPIRSILTISALAGGLVMVMFYAAMMDGMLRQMVHQATTISIGHLQVHRQAFIDDQDLYATLPWAYLGKMEQDFPQLKLAPRLYASGLASTADASNGVMIKAVDEQREPQVTSMLEKVRSGKLELGLARPSEEGFDRYFDRYNVVIGAQLAKNMQLEPGSELVLVTQSADGSIGNALYNVAAILKPIEPNFDRIGVLMSITAYQELMALPDGFHELAIRLDDISALEATQAALENELTYLTTAQPLDQLGGAPLVRNWRQIVPTISDLLGLSRVIVLIVGVIIISLASMGMLNTMLMAVHERTHEFGILQAIGMKRRWLLLMVLFESFFLALISALAGILLGLLIIGYFERHGIDLSGSLPDGFDWGGIIFDPVMQVHLQPMDVFMACILMMVVTMLSSLIPSWRAARANPAEMMR